MYAEVDKSSYRPTGTLNLLLLLVCDWARIAGIAPSCQAWFCSLFLFPLRGNSHVISYIDHIWLLGTGTGLLPGDSRKTGQKVAGVSWGPSPFKDDIDLWYRNFFTMWHSSNVFSLIPTLVLVLYRVANSRILDTQLSFFEGWWCHHFNKLLLKTEYLTVSPEKFFHFVFLPGGNQFKNTYFLELAEKYKRNLIRKWPVLPRYLTAMFWGPGSFFQLGGEDTSIILAFGRWTQEDQELEVSLS